MLADEVDAVIGGDTHRDSHALEMAAPNGGTIGTLAIGNDETGYADAIAWITQNSPGPRVIVGLEGTRSYGVGLTRALQAAGFLVLEVEQPRRADRRRGKSDPIDAHLAALQVRVCLRTGKRCRAATVTAKRCGSCLSRDGK
jgi:transposase